MLDNKEWKKTKRESFTNLLEKESIN
jgi:hypothetical protein